MTGIGDEEKLEIMQAREGMRFSNRMIILFVIPVFLEQLMISGMALIDTYMVSSLGESAVAGVSLVSQIDRLVKSAISALAVGGSIVLAQYIGAEDKKHASGTLLGCIHVICAIGGFISVVLLFAGDWLLAFVFGAVEKSVMEASRAYFFYLMLSYPLMALYNVGTATFRAMGESKIPMIASISMMTINIAFKYLFIFVMKLGVAGAGLSSLLGVGIVGICLTLLLRRPVNKVCVKNIFRINYNRSIVRMIFNVSVPNAIENSFFQLGVIILGSLVSTIGTAAIAANGVATNIAALTYSLSLAFAAVMLVIVGQCMGAKAPDEAEMYAKRILKMNYLGFGAYSLIMFFSKSR